MPQIKHFADALELLVIIIIVFAFIVIVIVIMINFPYIDFRYSTYIYF
jgi:hypothetical protein